MKINALLNCSHSFIKKEWRDASTLIIASNLKNTNSSSNSKVGYLVTERSKSSKFMPGGLCFPGGTVSTSDFSPKWSELYKNYGVDLSSLSFMSPNASIPEVYSSDPPNGHMTKEVSLRITAIRETFEECGILLCSNDLKSPKKNFNLFTSSSELKKWQKRVIEDPNGFISLCSELKVVPDLFSLYEWNNWLTPVSYKEARRRFDTIFYVVLLNEVPEISIDTHEVESCFISSAQNLVSDHFSGKKILLPPQLYEMSRMKGIKNFEELENLAKLRQEYGLTRWCPYLIITNDGPMSILQGDDLYPENLNVYEYQEQKKIDKSYEDLKKSSRRWNRFMYHNKGSLFLKNVPDEYGHTYPCSDLISKE